MAMPSTSAVTNWESAIESALPRSTQFESPSAAATLEHSRLQPRGFGHHGLVPRRVKCQLHAGRLDCRDALDFVFDIFHQDLSHAAAGCRQRHGDFDSAGAVRIGRDLALIDQPQIHDIDGDFRIEAGAHLVPGELLDVLFGGIGRQFRGLDRLLADGIRILPRNAEQIAFDVDGEAATQRLSDIAGLSRFQLNLDTRRHDDRAYLAVHDERLVLVGTHGYSVETGAALRSRAALSVCQQRLAHFTRAGYSRTPERAASLPRLESAAASCWVSRLWTLPNNSPTCALSLPLTASVIRDAEAVEMAQPLPSKRTSSMRSPFILRNTVRRSPHSGLWPSARASGRSRVPKL